jgi:hypothetical protein
MLMTDCSDRRSEDAASTSLCDVTAETSDFVYTCEVTSERESKLGALARFLSCKGSKFVSCHFLIFVSEVTPCSRRGRSQRCLAAVPLARIKGHVLAPEYKL